MVVRGIWSICVAVATATALVVPLGAAYANPPVDIHCVGLAVPDLVAEGEGQEDEGSDDPVNDTADLVPGGADLICVHDEDLAWTIAGAGGATRVAKYWTETNFNGSSLVLKIDNAIDGGDGCADGDKYGFASLGPFHNDIESGKGFNGCNTLKFFNYKNFGGSSVTLSTPASTLGSFNNKPSSTKVRS